jgi:anti-anti-sigma factor
VLFVNMHLLDRTADATAAVTVDLAAVTSIDSTVISALVKANNAATARGCRLTVANPGAQVRRVPHITGLLKSLAEDTA